MKTKTTILVLTILTAVGTTAVLARGRARGGDAGPGFRERHINAAEGCHSHASQECDRSDQHRRGRGKGYGRGNCQQQGNRHGRGYGRGNGQQQGNLHGQGTGYGRGEGHGRGNSHANTQQQKSRLVHGRGISYNDAQTGELKGRDVVRLGKVGTLSGTLAEAEETCEDGEKEYVLKSGDGVYNLHFGPGHYREENGITLADGAPVVVAGFVHENDIAVNSLAIPGNTYTFRDENGRPAWAGQGERSGSSRGGRGQGGGRGRGVAN